MGTHIEAFICFDDNPSSRDEPPFTYDPSYWDLTNDWRFSAGHHYEFFAAIAGVRNQSGKKPLYSLRGFPPRSPTDLMAERFNELTELWEGHTVGWLTLSEIEASLNHMGISRDSLDESVLLVLEAMSTMVRRYGNDRVRLIFGIH